MPTTIKHEMPYDAPVEQVAAMLGDPEFRREVTRRLDAKRADVTITPQGEGKQVRLDYWLDTQGVPSFAKKIVGNETNILQEETWSSAERADIKVTIPGKPGDMTGTAVLTPTPEGGTVETVTLTIKVSIPLVGGKIEDLIGKLLVASLKEEHRAGRDYLSSASA